MKVLVTGSRHLTDPVVITTAFTELLWSSGRPGPYILVHGAAPGADRLAAKMALSWGWQVHAVPADWASHGRAAGPLRNQRMLDEHPDVDVVYAFPDRDSVGTWDMVERAIKARIPVRIYPVWPFKE